MIETRGRQALVQYLADPGRSQSALAKAIGFPDGQTSVSAWVRGIARPGVGYRKALELVTGIPSDDWMTDEEVGQVERARAAQETTGVRALDGADEDRGTGTEGE